MDQGQDVVGCCYAGTAIAGDMAAFFDPGIVKSLLQFIGRFKPACSHIFGKRQAAGARDMSGHRVDWFDLSPESRQFSRISQEPGIQQKVIRFYGKGE
jgi:hypothetical protein